MSWKQVNLVAMLLISAAAAESKVIHVWCAGSLANNGTSWQDARPTIASGLSLAYPGDVIQVAGGLYNEKITIPSGVLVIGGYNPKGALNVWEPKRYRTVLSGIALTGPGVTFNSLISESTLMGFVIEDFVSQYGGGVFVNTGAKGGTYGCEFRRNTALSPTAQVGGGAMWISSGAEFEVASCIFRDNLASTTSPTLGDTAFGGAINIQKCTARVESCLFSKNVALAPTVNRSLGGAIAANYNTGSGSEVVIQLNTFSQSKADIGPSISINGPGVNTHVYMNVFERGTTSVPSSPHAVSAGAGAVGTVTHGWNWEDDVAPAYGWAGSTAAGPEWSGNPGFVCTVDENLRLSAGSLCLDALPDASMPKAASFGDVDGNLRPSLFDELDCGGYESVTGTTFPWCGLAVHVKGNGSYPEFFRGDWTGKEVAVIVKAGTETWGGSAYLDGWGNAHFEFPFATPGPATAWVKVEKCLAVSFNVSLSLSATACISSQFPGGDIDDDNVISVWDYLLFGDAFNLTVCDSNWWTQGFAADLNGDGEVSFFDYDGTINPFFGWEGAPQP